MSVLLLGGTTEAQQLAEQLVADGVAVVTSLAGGATRPRLPAGEVRIGGFGGAAGLASHLCSHGVIAVVDATHPFAATITANAAAACAQTGVPLLRLSRPSWAGRPDAAGWNWVDSPAQARLTAARLGDRVFLAIGRQSLAEFTDWDAPFVLARVIDPPTHPPPAGWQVVRARGPFGLDDELALLRHHRIDVLVTKDSGGPTDAKLDAAHLLGVAVVCLRRPPSPAAVAEVATVAEARAWVIVAIA